MINSAQARIPYSDLLVGARFLARLPRYLRFRIDPERAQALLSTRLERREADFLALARRAIYPVATSPARRLLELAGCTYGDLERLVHQEGLDGALQALYRQGVYLTVEELKGRRPVVRGSTSFSVNLSSLANPTLAADILRYGSGSRGPMAPVPVSLSALRDRAVNLCLALRARGGIGWQHAVWEVPGGALMMHVLETAPFDAPVARWFSQLDPTRAGLHPRYRWSARLMRLAALLNGVDLPRAMHVPIDAPLPIARWLADSVRSGLTPHLKTYASSAVRLSQAAQRAGLDLAGAQLTISGEPATPARLATIARSGATAVPRCGTSEAGTIGYGCLAPQVGDELHLFDDLNAFVQPGSIGGPIPPRGLLVTALRPSARLILLNASLGDQGELRRRNCGCPLETYGWTTHLHTLRSFEKLTCGGMTFLDVDVARVLEETLPQQLGGGPTDFQLVEDEQGDGQPRLRLLVHPRLGPVDETRVSETLLAALGTGTGVERIMAQQWREGHFLKIERQPPRITPAGKVLHLHRDAVRD